jgi:hypothetical protein
MHRSVGDTGPFDGDSDMNLMPEDGTDADEASESLPVYAFFGMLTGVWIPESDRSNTNRCKYLPCSFFSTSPQHLLYQKLAGSDVGSKDEQFLAQIDAIMAKFGQTLVHQVQDLSKQLADNNAKQLQLLQSFSLQAKSIQGSPHARKSGSFRHDYDDVDGDGDEDGDDEREVANEVLTDDEFNDAQKPRRPRNRSWQQNAFFVGSLSCS